MKIIKESNSYSSEYNACLLDVKKNKWFFKELNNEEIFKELLAYEIATILGLNHVNTIPYIFRNRKGVISPSFMKDGNKYISGYDLLSIYIAETEENDRELLYDRTTFYGSTMFKRKQDLYIIWQAVEAKFKNYPNYDNQIKKFMDDIINMILFDLLNVNYDRHSNNWIIEYNDTSFRLCPMFDNNLSFTDKSYSKLNTSQEFIPNEKALEFLLTDSDDSIYERYVNFSGLVNPDNIDNIIDNTIKKHNLDISEYLRNKIINNFIVNYERLAEVIDSHKKEAETNTAK